MPAMTKTALSDFSYPESTVYNIRDDIDTTITRLKVAIDEDASLRKALRVLFVKRRVDAIEQVRLANLHLDLVNEEEAAFCDDLMKAVASANEVCHLILMALSHAYHV
jgi:endonuclease/exonuclease/phosphatase family metal-dependent hydrolase